MDERGIVSKSKLTALANKIKTKASVSGAYTLDDLVDVVDDIETGGITPTGTKQVSITQNGTTTEDVTNYASAEITVNVGGGGSVSVETLNVTENGTTDAPEGTAYNKVIVNVPTGVMFEYIKALAEDGLRYAVLPDNCFFTNLKNVGTHALANSTGCKNLVLPAVTTMGSYPISDMADLEKMDVGVSSPNFGGNYFASGCRKLNTIIIRKTSAIVTLNNVNSLAATPFASGGTGGTLYVPNSLISSYSSASNWSTILGYANNSILPIEGSYYETHYADGTTLM